MKWIPVKERLPEVPSGQMCIRVLTTDGKSIDARVFYKDWVIHETDMFGIANKIATHWMDLKEIPLPNKESCEAPCQLCKARHKTNHEVKL